MVRIAFFPHNQPHTEFFSLVACNLGKKGRFHSSFVKEIGKVEEYDVFQFETELEKIWNDIDISPTVLRSLQDKYPNFDFMRALYSEREFNYYPLYFSADPVSREHQLKYLVGSFEVFNQWLDEYEIKYIVSELIIGLADGVLREVAEHKGIEYLSVRQSKMISGVVITNSYYDEPIGIQNYYKKYLTEEIPENVKEMAISHIRELNKKIEHPSYMELTKKPLKITPFNVAKSLTKGALGLGRTKSVTALTIRKHERLEAYKTIWHRLINLYHMRINYKHWFDKQLHEDDKYIIYPLHYEPEASTLVRAFHFSDQLALIKMIAKVLPLDVVLVVKEHSGNRGYRNPEFYKELSYMPNVVLRPPEYNVTKLLSKCMCVITLTGRMGWEAIVNNKPVITMGRSFWSSFDGVHNVQSWKELSSTIIKIHKSSINSEQFDENKLLAFASAYIRCVYDANFVINSSSFLTEENVEKFTNMIIDFIEQKSIVQ